ncbi:MAG: acetyltransferase [Nitrospirae bacterium]|nr:acetyltransferase [Nitrospirota bacterium]
MNSSPSDKPLILIGAGGHGRVLLDIIQLRCLNIIGIIDKELEKSEICGVKVLGNDDVIERYSPKDVQLINGIGSIADITLRKNIYEMYVKKGYTFAAITHPSTVIGSNVQLSNGSQVMAGAVIQCGSSIGENSIINSSSSIDHDCVIGSHCHIAPGVIMSGGVKVGDGTHISTGVVIIQGINIGRNVFIAAGSVVTKDIGEGISVIGSPAREFVLNKNV